MNFDFQEATRYQSKASIVIEGLSGTGKTGLSLQIARALADYPDIYAMDTECKSMNLFEGIKLTGGEPIGKFKKVDVPANEAAPSTFLEFRDAACAQGAKVCIQDSTTHAWAYVLDAVTAANNATGKISKAVNGWGDPTVVPEKNILSSALWRDERCHVISTVRMKEKIVIGEDKTVTKIGEQPIQQDQVKYEPDLIIHLTKAGTPDGEPAVGLIEKSRYAIFKPGQEYLFTDELCAQLAAYLDEGVSPEELLAKQQANMVKVITDMLNGDKTLGIKFKMFKKTAGLGDEVKLADMSLDNLNKLYNILYV